MMTVWIRIIRDSDGMEIGEKQKWEISRRGMR
jgi:hypothetical protein